jgi:exonuclease SbcC
VEKLVRSGTSSMEVVVVFTAGGRKYRAVRKRSRGSSDSRLFSVNGQTREIRSGDSGVDEEISSIIGIDRYLFSNAIYVRQGEIERLLTETPFKKKQLIGKLLGIESLEKVWESMKPIIDTYRDKKSRAEGEMVREDELVKRRSELEREIGEVRGRIEKTKRSIESVQSQLLDAEKKEGVLMEAEKKHEGLAVKRDELSSMLERELDRLNKARSELSSVSEAKKEMSMIERKLAPGWKHDIDSGINELQRSVSESEGKLGALRGRIEEMKELQEKLRTAGGSCPLCGSELTGSHRKLLVKERGEKISSMRKESSKLSRERDGASREIGKLRSRRDEFHLLEKRMGELMGALGRREELMSIVKEGERITSGLGGKIRDIDVQLKRAEASRKAWEKARHDVSLFRVEAEALREAYGRQQGKLQEIEASLKRAEKEVSEMQARKEEHARLSDFIGILGEIRNLFDKSGLQMELRKRAVPAIESHIRDFFREFNFEYSDISLSEDYDVTLHGPGGPSTGLMMSGGERIAAALALRLGIARTLAGSSAETVMLDEPTIFLDEQRRQDLIEVLRKMSVMPQMIVVTHDPAMEDAADSVTVIKKEKGVSYAGA